tara:strand:- start:165 stop:404 length:240 start_codon:yes stop_codon:yes gene_type:complete
MTFDEYVCEIKNCTNPAKEEFHKVSEEQRYWLKAFDDTSYICINHRKEGWKYNPVSQKYYFSPSKRAKVKIVYKQEKIK